ncbi:hypothetical protein BJV74DRAFT_883905 [Russula compacta]|nr:hypothetical protein BJV74DRAFT_883905 [Russula compacta]
MSSSSTATDNHLPSEGEIIVVRLFQDLSGPGSTLGSARDLPSRSTRRNYHHAVVINLSLNVFESTITLTVFPMPAYSATDPTSGLSSTSWLLGQPVDFQKLHIPVPHEQIPPLTLPHPPFPTPAQFGDPIKAGGWKSRNPCWIQVVPVLAKLKYVTKFKCYEPPAKLSSDEVRRLKVYSALSHPSVFPDSSTMPSFPQGGGSATPGPHDASSLGKDTAPGSGSSQHPMQDSGLGTAASGAGGSFALQALYATDVVKQAFANLSNHDRPVLILDSNDDDVDDDDDDDWEDGMDPITFARYYAAQNPHLAKIVQDHDSKMRQRRNKGITRWVEGVQSETV